MGLAYFFEMNLRIRNIFIFLFFAFLFVACSSNNGAKKIAIQPFLGISQNYVLEVKQALELYYGISVVVLKPIALPQKAFVNIKSPRYRADSLIRFLRRNKADSIDFIIGLTHRDISITKRDKKGNIKKPESRYKDFGIFGLGFRPGSSCVVSIFRLASGKNGKSKHLSRLKKIACHEIGHNFGLKHCQNKKCFMQDAAEKISTIDGVSNELCAACLKKINY